VGRLDPIKGFDLLINAWNLAKLNSTSWKLIIVGDGPERDNLNFLINRLGLNSKVIVLPATSNIEKYYSECRLFISSSTHEGFGLAMIEALHFNSPVISFPTEGARKILINNYNGIILKDFNVEDLALGIQNTLNNEDILNKLAEKTQDSVRHLNVEKISKNWEIIWQIKSL
jgi:glycosyltransferase involved in cell wall biosynthesis